MIGSFMLRGGATGSDVMIRVRAIAPQGIGKPWHEIRLLLNSKSR